MNRSRPIQLMLMAIVTATGLASRSSLAVHLPAFVGNYAGDTLWALMVFLTLGFIFPAASTWRIAFLSLAISVAVELSQLIDSRLIRSIRNTWLGSILLGHDFLWSDFICYATGVGLGAKGERWVTRVIRRFSKLYRPNTSAPIVPRN